MKQILMLGMLTTISVLSFSQVIPLNTFIGTWRWSQNSDTVLFAFQSQPIKLYELPAFTGLIGWHKYVKNGAVKESSLQYFGSSYNDEFAAGDLSSTLLNFKRGSNYITFFFHDLTLNKSCQLKCTLVPGSVTQMTCHISNSNEFYDGPPGIIALFTLPQDFTLTKLP